ncbi:hypothetical protein KSS87_003705 [Heliosperma pusillum]|nr:hypothetical protein KSS87_003705 [Heliosperma pusillum]
MDIGGRKGGLGGSPGDGSEVAFWLKCLTSSPVLYFLLSELSSDIDALGGYCSLLNAMNKFCIGNLTCGKHGGLATMWLALDNLSHCLISARISSSGQDVIFHVEQEIPLLIAGEVIKTGTRTASALLTVTLALVEMLLVDGMGFGRNAIGGRDGRVYVITDPRDNDAVNA